MRRIAFTTLLFWLVAALLLAPVAPLRAADDDALESLGFIEEEPSSLVNVSRSPRPASRIAENVTVITAADIERLNAHTLADVLQTVPGIQMDYLRTPSTFSFFNVQGAYGTTVLVLVDGVRQNDFQQGMAIPGLIPVQQIERIEIVKGSASAAWGAALGGVINIVTKSPDPDQAASGMVSGSLGSKFTADARAELSGITDDNLSYYLTAGHIHSDGLTPNTGTGLNNLYAKFSHRLPDNGTLTFGLWHLNARPGLDEADTASWGFVHDNNEYLRNNVFLKLNQPLSSMLSLDVDGYFTYRDDHTKYGGLDSQGAIVFFNDYVSHETTRGVNARLTWGDSQRNLVTGVEFVNADGRGGDLLNPPMTYDQSWNSFGLYANGAWSIGRFTLLPGIRRDFTGLAGNVTSYTLGGTCQLTDNTTLRAYAAEGFGLPSLNSPGSLQKVKTLQGGIESGAVPYLWLKGTWFYNTLRNSLSSGFVPTVTDQNRQGFEVEARTTPLYNMSLATGYTYLYATDTASGARLQTDSSQAVPPHTVKAALHYDHSDLGLRGTLTGNYVWWNAGPTSMAANRGMVWDLHLNWKLNTKSELSPELFFSGHNLFNNLQTTDTELYSNPNRWFDGGIRVRF
ncbi:MAG: hypothetical protein A2076_07030 [Geobacteraceae bacterium GWC2_53_11]|nr:MAG: hypothetical protein A2076_07030 [Geobacteraceae bacterium GWC2_53_11]